MTVITATSLVAPEFQFVDADGEVLEGGKVYSYEAGLSTPKVTYTDSTNDTPNTNPVILDNFGKAAIYLKGTYKIVLKDKNDVEIYTQDNISAYSFYDFTGLTATIPDLNSTITKAEIKTLDYPIVVGDRGKTILVDATAGDVNIQLPDPATDSEFTRDVFKIIIKKIDVSNFKVNINPDGSDTIGGDTQFILHDFGDFVEIHLKDPDWYIVASQQRGTIIGVTPASIPTITLKDNGKTYICDTSGGNIAITLPDTSVVGKGFAVTFKRTTFNASTVTLNPTGGQLIDGASILVFENETSEIGVQGSTIKSDGTNWYALNYINGFIYYDDVRLPSPVSETGVDRDPLTAWDLTGPNAGDIVQQFTYTPILKNSMLDISFDFSIHLYPAFDVTALGGIALFENSVLLQRAVIQMPAFSGADEYLSRYLIYRNIHSLQLDGATKTYTIQLKINTDATAFTWGVDDVTNSRSGVTIREYI